MSKIYIIGHRNPDVDSVCSATAYAKLKQLLGFKDYTAARCGNSNSRIDKIFDKFGAPLPEFVGDVRLRARDAMKTNFISLGQNASCYSVMEAIDRCDIRAIPLVDEKNRLLGEVSVFDLGEFFIPRPREVREVRRLCATLSDVVNTLNATVHIIFDADKTEDMYVRIGAMEVSSFDSFIQKEGSAPEQNLIVVGDRFDIQIKAVQIGVKAIIVTGGYDIDPAVLDMAKSKGVSIISCPYDSATTALLVRMATRALPLLRKDYASVRGDFPLSKISSQIKKFFGKTIFVQDAEGRIEGIFTNTDLLDLPKPQLVLVDHNELSQAVLGADEADILEIIDHHRISSPSTANPILFINEPVGSTCTIISRLYAQCGIVPDRTVAGLLLSGIVCDTLNLKSPTSTPEDSAAAETLSKLAGITPGGLAEFIFGTGSIISSSSADEIVSSDCKTYEENSLKFSVSQVEEPDFANFFTKIDELRRSLERRCTDENLLFAALLVTNVTTQDSLLIIAGNDDFIGRINYPRNAAGNAFELHRIVSRKKQLIPYLSSVVKDFNS